jgi:hypothetical protein
MEFMEGQMAKRSISAWVDEGLAGKVDQVALDEGHKPAQILASATEFYMALPEVARRKWRQILLRGTDEEINLALREVTRSLVRTHLNMSINRGHDHADRVRAELGISDDEQDAALEEVAGDRDRG